jgi:hypothetical protein
LGDNDRIGSPAALATAVIALIGAKTSDLEMIVLKQRVERRASHG